MNTERQKQLEAVKKLWAALGNVPIDQNERIEIPYLGFPPGTHRETIWQWFEDSLGVSVVYLMRGESETKPWIEE